MSGALGRRTGADRENKDPPVLVMSEDKAKRGLPALPSVDWGPGAPKEPRCSEKGLKSSSARKGSPSPERLPSFGLSWGAGPSPTQTEKQLNPGPHLWREGGMGGRSLWAAGVWARQRADMRRMEPSRRHRPSAQTPLLPHISMGPPGNASSTRVPKLSRPSPTRGPRVSLSPQGISS